MDKPAKISSEGLLAKIHAHVEAENIFITTHAQQEMDEEGITSDDVLQAIRAGHILENYPDDQRGPSCLLNGVCGTGRLLHIVCATQSPVLIIITVYEPKRPKWTSPTKRRKAR